MEYLATNSWQSYSYSRYNSCKYFENERFFLKNLCKVCEKGVPLHRFSHLRVMAN